MEDCLTLEERRLLLHLAREAVAAATCGEMLKPLCLEQLSPRLRAPGVTFVTLTRKGELRGCVGALEPSMPLAEDVRAHAQAAAMEDFRFPPVCPGELPEIKIEISRLTCPEPMNYDCPEDLLAKLKPGMDGVVLHWGKRRATFLPQVWEKVPDAGEFLDHLCLNMGVPASFWRCENLQVETYQVEEFHDGDETPD